MRLLIIGGTIFVGRHLVVAAKERGHEVTLFNRGKHNPGLFPDVENIIGDRKNPDDIAELAKGKWDAVIDTCGYIPRETRLSAEALKDSADFYCFISTVSVYSDWTKATISEASPLGTLEDPTVETVTGETYGPLKVLCEDSIREAFGKERTLVVRPGLIVGPNDPTDRFTYWPHRVAQGGTVLVPGDEELTAQYIDVRDLAEWTIRLVEQKTTGTYNAVALPVRFSDLVSACRDVAGGDANFVYVPESFLEEQGVAPWSELPLWLPRSGDDTADVDVSLGIANGLTFRPVEVTVADTLAWDQSRTDTETSYRNTLKPEKEADVLDKYNQTLV